MLDIKSNKVDTEAAMKGIDVLHKQVEHILMLTVEMLKTFATDQK